MPTYTRLEIMNLMALYGDTQDLSTIRGGGLALLLGPDRAFPTADCVSGASQAMCQGDGPVAIRKIGRVLHHGTVAVQKHNCAAGTAFDEAQSVLTAKCRFEQMQSATIHYPPVMAAQLKVCAEDHTRPAVELSGTALSPITRLRKNYGRRMRQHFYNNELSRAGKSPVPLSFTSDLKGLAGNSQQWGPLQDKIAVIHLDGNKLGSRFARLRTWDEYKAQSKQYRNDYQAGFLHSLLTRIASNPSEWQNNGAARLETLLWGGDEIRFVVPAWKGFELLTLFYSESAAWKLGNDLVTHSAGIVFAHHNAPIHQLCETAKQLAEFAKETTPSANCFAYQVLESFDTNSCYLDAGEMQRMHPFAKADLACLSLTPQSLTRLGELARTAQDSLPRRQIFELARRLALGKEPPADSLNAQRNKILGQLAPDVRMKFENLSPAAWFHLNELWDYLAPQKRVL